MTDQVENHDQNDDKNQVVVLMVPFPAHSHLNQLLSLSHRLAATYNLPIHYLSTTVHNHQVRLRHQSTTTTSSNLIHFHDLDISPPPMSSSFLDTRLPNIAAMRRHVHHHMRRLASLFRRLIVIHDCYMSSTVEDLTSFPNVESYTFHPFPPFSLFFHLWEATNPKPFELDPDVDRVLGSIPLSEWCPLPRFSEFIASQYKLSQEFEVGRVFNTSREIEGKYVELLGRLSPAKHFAIGPFNPMEMVDTDTNTDTDMIARVVRNKCLEWLDQQEGHSVVYVSFGTTVPMNDEQIREVVIGLENSGLGYLLALGGSNYENGSTQKVEPKNSSKRGLVVRDWAPQLEILGHPATGGFMTHCGWGSCIESISMGVPVACWPMHSDQPNNSVLMAQVLKMGLIVREWEKSGEIVSSSVVEDVVKRLLVSEEGNEMRKRAKELRNALKESIQLHNGASEMDSFVCHITR